MWVYNCISITTPILFSLKNSCSFYFILFTCFIFTYKKKIKGFYDISMHFIFIFFFSIRSSKFSSIATNIYLKQYFINTSYFYDKVWGFPKHLPQFGKHKSFLENFNMANKDFARDIEIACLISNLFTSSILSAWKEE